MHKNSNLKQEPTNQPSSDIQIFISNCQGSQQDLYFDIVVGALQDIVLQPNFANLQQSFMRNNCNIFTQCQENKLQYTTIFQQYEQTVQKYIMQKLKQKVKNFNMEAFCNLLATRHGQIDEQLLEIVESFVDFQVFKNMMLAYKEYLDKDKLGMYDGLMVKGMGKYS